MIVFVVTLVHGAGAAVYVFTAAVVEGWVGLCESWAELCSGPVGVAGAGDEPDDMTQPVQASTATGSRRAVRASGRGSERTTHFSWGTVRRSPHCGRDDSVT